VLKKLIPAVVMTALVLSLVGCTGSGSSTASCTPTKSGAASAKVTVTGKSTKTAAKFPKKLSAKKTQRTELKPGTGKASADGDTVTVDYVVYNATSGKKLDSQQTKTGEALPLSKGLLPGLDKALLCTSKGARVVAVIPPADAFGSAGSAQLGIGAKDNIVFVLDVLSVKTPPKSTPTPTAPATPALPKADGAAQPAPAGYPTVTLAANGAPTITVPKTAAPTTLEIADLKKGTGAVVASGDSVTVHYTGVVWDTNTVFDSSWTRGQPATFTTDGVIAGFGKALVGQTVGSQVIAIIPPADGYGPAGSPPAIKGTDTLVFVVDILADAAK
jgi:FKBP-type peptidyl-prolyl cis-trans isomerase